MSPCRSKQRLYETRAGPPRRAGSGRCTLPTTLSTDSRAPTLEQAKAEFVVRKGATPLYPAQRGFVGGSMGDISVILKGKPKGMAAGLLNSTIHGSGRVMSRTQAAGKSRWVKGRKVSQGGGHIRHRDGAVAEDCCDGRLGRARPLQGLTWFVRLVALAGDWLLR